MTEAMRRRKRRAKKMRAWRRNRAVLWACDPVTGEKASNRFHRSYRAKTARAMIDRVIMEVLGRASRASGQ